MTQTAKNHPQVVFCHSSMGRHDGSFSLEMIASLF